MASVAAFLASLGVVPPPFPDHGAEWFLTLTPGGKSLVMESFNFSFWAGVSSMAALAVPTILAMLALGLVVGQMVGEKRR